MVNYQVYILYKDLSYTRKNFERLSDAFALVLKERDKQNTLEVTMCFKGFNPET